MPKARKPSKPKVTEDAPVPGLVEIAPPVARVLKAQQEGTEVAPVFVTAPADADWFSSASTPDETVAR